MKATFKYSALALAIGLAACSEQTTTQNESADTANCRGRS